VFKGAQSNVRSDDAHYVYAGAEEDFTKTIHGSVRVGAEYVDYYNAIDSDGNRHPTDRVSPYAEASLDVRPAVADEFKLGVKVVHSATDEIGVLGQPPILDAFTKAVFIANTYKITEAWTAGVNGSFQDSSFVGGGGNLSAPGAGGDRGKSQEFGIAAVNVSYHFNKWLSADAGYVYNRLVSNIPGRDYVRNFVFLGFQGSWGR
jgi:hypothetical protein